MNNDWRNVYLIYHYLLLILKKMSFKNYFLLYCITVHSKTTSIALLCTCAKVLLCIGANREDHCVIKNRNLKANNSWLIWIKL